MNRAVFYIVSTADNYRYVREARLSAISVDEKLDLPRHLFLCGEKGKLDYSAFTEVHPLPSLRGPFWYLDSTRFFVHAVEHLTQYDELLYLDTDTFIASPCINIFDVLQKYDLAIAQSPQRDCCNSTLSPAPPESFCTMENGVNVFRNNPKMRQWLRQEWLERFERHPLDYDNNDNGPLRDALWVNTFNIRWCTLAPEWGLRFDFGCWVVGRVRILHGRRGGISNDQQPLDVVAEKINETGKMRVWMHGKVGFG